MPPLWAVYLPSHIYRARQHGKARCRVPTRALVGIPQLRGSHTLDDAAPLNALAVRLKSQMRYFFPPSPLAMAAVLATVTLSCAPARTPTPNLPCAAADSLRAAPLRFSDAIYGIRGTSGGTFIELLNDDSTGWQLSLEPVESEFPDESHQWPLVAETLGVRWSALPSGQASLVPQLPRSDTLPNTVDVIGDSLTLTVACDTTRLFRWGRRRPVDTLLLERRQNRGGPG